MSMEKRGVIDPDWTPDPDTTSGDQSKCAEAQSPKSVEELDTDVVKRMTEAVEFDRCCRKDNCKKK